MLNFWKGKKVLVTGHTGFVGSWLCCVLKDKGADVTGFSLREEAGSLFGKIKNDLAICSVYGDLRNGKAIRECIEVCRPEIVFHLAAFGFVKECYENADRAYSSNIMGTLNLLNAIRGCNDVKKIVVASSDKVYLNSRTDAYLFKESDSLGGMDTYSASKTCEDLLVQSFFDSYLSDTEKSVCIVRPSNILGGGDHNMNRLIPSIYYNLRHGKEPKIRNPNSVRPWQDVLDMADAYLTLAWKSGNGCTIYNVGPEEMGIKTVGEIRDFVMHLYGKYGQKYAEGSFAVKEKAYLGLSIDKIKREIGWRPRHTLEQTLDEIYEFYQADDGLCTYGLCMKQIQGYYGKSEEENNGTLEQ